MLLLCCSDDAAQEALTDMPPRSEEVNFLICITLCHSIPTDLSPRANQQVHLSCPVCLIVEHLVHHQHSPPQYFSPSLTDAIPFTHLTLFSPSVAMTASVLLVGDVGERR